MRPAIQLYTLRHLDEPLPALIERVATAGFEGVEFANRFMDTDPEAVRERLDATGTVPVAAHVDLELLETFPDSLRERAETVGVERFIIPHISIDHYRTADRLDSLIDRLTQVSTQLDGAGYRLGIHTDRLLLFPFFHRGVVAQLNRINGLPTGAYNHLAWGVSRSVPRTEATLLESSALGRIASQTPDIDLEIDVKSIAQSGFSYETVFETFADTLSMIHLSDVEQTRRFPPAYRPVDIGDGIVSPAAALAALERRPVTWIVTEHDAPDDPIDALERCAAAVSAGNISLPRH